MQPVKITLSSQTESAWVPMNINQSPFNVGIGVVLTGTATYTVQHTFDDVQDQSVTPVPFSNEGITSKTSNEDGNYAFPVRAIRLNVTSYTSGDISMTIIQGD